MRRRDPSDELTCRRCHQSLKPKEALRVIPVAGGAISYVHRPTVSWQCFERGIGPRSIHRIEALEENR